MLDQQNLVPTKIVEHLVRAGVAQRQSTTLVKQKQHFLITKFHRKIQSKNSICWCGSAVEHHLGKVGVTGPIPVTSSIENPYFIRVFSLLNSWDRFELFFILTTIDNGFTKIHSQIPLKISLQKIIHLNPSKTT